MKDLLPICVVKSVVNYDDSPEIRSLFNLLIIEWEFQYGMNISYAAKGKELFIKIIDS